MKSKKKKRPVKPASPAKVKLLRITVLRNQKQVKPAGQRRGGCPNPR